MRKLKAVRMRHSYLFLKLIAVFVLAVMSHVTATHASTWRFDVSFSTGDVGWIDIDDSFVAPNAAISAVATDVSFTINGVTFSKPQNVGFTFFQMDSSGTQISSLLAVGPGRFLPFGVTASSRQTINLSEGSVPGSFETRNAPGGDVSGTFSIAEGVIKVVPPTTSPVPLPASAWALLTAVGALFAIRAVRREDCGELV